ncbi:DELTA-thalatoxin-Avl2a isoform X2 [Exaiptasia diaphana]|nr:DELTA-thalatoxin-Avl2a isoform X2 [Exaiptasia diaphana]
MRLHFKTTTILLLLLFAVVVQCGTVEDDPHHQPQFDPAEEKPEKIEIKAEPSVTSRGALGQGFEIHKEDLLTKQFKGTGAKIFEDLPMDECTKTDKLGAIQKDDSFYSSTESLYNSISTNTKVSGSLKGTYTLGASVDAVTNNIASSETEVQGLSLNIRAYSLSSALKKDCINKKSLVKDLVEAFEALPSKVDQPWKITSWKQYKVFLSKYGSHFVKESISGSSIYQYVFAKSDKKFSQKDFTVKACVSLAGPTQAGKAEVSACAGVTKKDIEKSSSQSMTKKLVVRGGKLETRAELTGELKAEQIKKFLKEAETDPSPIQYYFYPIWELLKVRYVGKEQYAKAANLEQFYKGFLHFGCTYKKTSNGKEIQKFDLAEESDPESPTYVCKLGPEGCHVDDDCHYKDAFWCACYGDSCLRYKDTQLKAGGIKKEAYAYKSGTRWGWQGCQRKVFSCYCSDPRKNWETSWRGEDLDNALRDVHSMLLEKNRRDQAKRHRLHR